RPRKPAPPEIAQRMGDEARGIPTGGANQVRSVAGKVVALCAASAALSLAGVANASNPQIAGLQVALRAYNLYHGPIDSIAGPLTVRATKEFQRRVGLAADGRVGLRTRRALGPLGVPLFGKRT